LFKFWIEDEGISIVQRKLTETTLTSHTIHHILRKTSVFVNVLFC